MKQAAAVKRSPGRLATTCALLASLVVGAGALAGGVTACGGGKTSAAHPAQPAATARSGPAPAPTAPGNAGRALLQLFQDLATQVKAAPDCNQFAALLNSWVNREQDRVKQLVAQVGNKASSMSEPDVDDLKARLTDAVEVVISRANKCKDNPAAQSAFKAFQMIQST